MEQQNFVWDTYEYSHTKKSADWFWAVGIISVGIVATTIILGNTLFALVILIGSVTLMMYAGRTPAVVQVVVNDVGIQVGKYLYPYSGLASFWFYLHQKETRLLLRSKKTFIPLISIIIPHEIHLEELRDFLKERMKEEELHEPIFQHLLEYIGF